MLIYKQLGADAESEFSSQWGIGYAMDSVRHVFSAQHPQRTRATLALRRLIARAQASEWQEVLKTAVKAALILVLLDLLRITR
jgi:hypothetical protein